MVFGHSVRTKMAKGGPKLKNQWGSNKIEVVPICLGNPHFHGEIQQIILYPALSIDIRGWDAVYCSDTTELSKAFKEYARRGVSNLTS